MRVLIVSPYLPHAQVGHGGGISTYHFALELARRQEVEVLCFARHGETAHAADLAAAGIRLTTVALRSPRDPRWTWPLLVADRTVCWLLAWLRREPPMVAKYRRRRMRQTLLRTVERFQPDVVQFEFSLLANCAAALRRWRGSRRSPLVLLNSHEAALLPRQRRRAQSSGLARIRHSIDLWLWTAHERRALLAADLLQCVTEQDRAIYLGLGASPTRLWHQPLGVDVDRLPQAAPAQVGAKRLIFLGSFDHAPNRDAVRCLRWEIFPRLSERHPSLVLDIVGARPPVWLLQDQDPRVRVHGFVAQLDHIFDGASAFVAPLRYGGGIKIKVLEAMARGAAVVTTPIGIEGIDVVPEQHVLVAGDVDALVAQTDRLLCEPAAAHELGKRARACIRGRYGWPVLVDAFEHRVRSASGATSGDGA